MTDSQQSKETGKYKLIKRRKVKPIKRSITREQFHLLVKEAAQPLEEDEITKK